MDMALKSSYTPSNSYQVFDYQVNYNNPVFNGNVFSLPLDDMPPLPDNAAGTLYARSTFTSADINEAGGNGWSMYREGSGWPKGRIAISNGMLAVTPQSGDGPMIRLTIVPIPNQNYFILKIMPSVSCTISVENDNPTYQNFALTPNSWNYVSGYFSETGTLAAVDIDGIPVGSTTYIGSAYIGDGTYASDNVAYAQSDWATVDGWDGGGSTANITNPSGKLRCTATIAGFTRVYKNLSPSITTTKTVRFAVSSSTTKVLDVYNGASGYLGSITPVVGTQSVYQYTTVLTTGVSIQYQGTPAINDYFEIDWIDITDGLYGPILDTSPNAKQFTLQTGVVRVDGPSGYALDTTYGGAYCPDETGLPMGNSARTIAIWFKTVSPGSGNRQLVVYGAGSTGNAVFVYHSSGTSTFVLDLCGTKWNVSDTGMLDGKFHQIVVTTDGASNTKIYLDGVQVASGTLAFNTVSGMGLTLGYYNAGLERWQGQLALPQIWNRALSQLEVSYIYQNPVSYMPFTAFVPVLADSGSSLSQEDMQNAQMAAYLQYGSIPQLPNFGVQWAEYFTGSVDFGIVDGQIKSNLISVGLQNFRPIYDIVNEKLTVSVVSK